NGPWSDLWNAASPFSVPGADARLFFRVRIPGAEEVEPVDQPIVSPLDRFFADLPGANQIPRVTAEQVQATRCPAAVPRCSPAVTKCRVAETVCPPAETKCPAIATVCPAVETRCPPRATRCPTVDTRCPVVETQCPVFDTRCPAQETQCP